MSVMSHWSIGLFNFPISLLIFGLVVLPISDRGIFKSTSVIVDLFLPSILPVFAYFEALLLSAYIDMFLIVDIQWIDPLRISKCLTLCQFFLSDIISVAIPSIL